MASHIFKPSASVRIFRAVDSADTPIPSEAIATSVLQHAYIPSLRDSDMAEYVHGFCSPRDITNSDMAGDDDINFGEFVAAGYRFSRRKPDPTSLRIAVKARIISHVENWNQTHPDKQISVSKLTKSTKAEIVASCKNELLPQSSWREKMVGVMYFPSRGMLVVAGATEKEAEAISLRLQHATEDATTFTEVGLFDLPVLFGLKTTEEFDAFIDTLSGQNTSYSKAVSEAIRHIWFLSETMTGQLSSRDVADTHGYLFTETDGGVVFDTAMSGEQVVCAETTGDDKIVGPTVCSKNGDHSAVRYAMWKKDLNVLSGSFLFTASHASYPRITLSASSLAVFGLNGIVTPDCKLSEKASSEDLESTVILYLSRVLTSISMLASVAVIFMQARQTEARWDATRKAERSWLEEYAPSCEVAAEHSAAVTGSATDVQQ